MAVFGSGTPVSKLVTGAFPPFLASGLRLLLAALVLLPFVLRSGFRPRSVGRGDALRIGVIAVVGMFGFSLAMLHGMRLVSGTVGSVVMSSTPAVTAGGAALFLGESVGARRAGGIALTVAGLLVLHLAGGGDGGGGYSLAGAALVFLAVLCEATYTLMGKRVTADLDPPVVAWLSALAALPLFVPGAVVEAGGMDWASVPVGAWLALGWWGAGTLGLGSLLWYSGVQRAAGSTAAGFMGVMPVSALILSYMLLGDPFVPLQVLGFGVVLAGVLLIARQHAREAS